MTDEPNDEGTVPTEPTAEEPPPVSTVPEGTDESPDSLDDKLAEAKKQLGKARDRQTESASDVAKFTSEVAALETLKKDLDKSLSDYEDAHHDLESQDQALRDYLEFEEERLREELGKAGTAAVEAVVDAKWKKLVAARYAVTSAKRHLKRLEEDHTHLDETRAETLQTMTNNKNLVATIRDRLKELQARKAEIGAAHDEDNPAVAYWLLAMAKFPPPLEPKSLNFAHKLEAPPELIEPDELPEKLEAVVTAHNLAEAAFADIEAELAKQQERVTEAEVAVKSIEKSFLEDLHKELTALKPRSTTSSPA